MHLPRMGRSVPVAFAARMPGTPFILALRCPERADAVVTDLMQPSSISGLGIRALAATEVR